MTPTEGEAVAPDLDRLAALAAHALQAPIVLAVIVSERSARVAGQAGHAALAGAEVGDPSFARRVAIRGASSDAAALHGTWEARVTGAQAALGVPIQTAVGSPLGVLLALDVSPRPWTADQLEAASTIARTVADRVDRHTLLARLSEAERLGAVLMRSPESIVIHVDGRIRFANPAALALFSGHAQEDVVGHAIDRFILPPFLKHLEQTLVRPVPADGPPAVFEARLMRVDGAVRWVEVAALGYLRGEPLRDEAGQVSGTVGVALDTTIRRRTDERDRAEAELGRLEQIAGGVAHGVNNALAAIVGLASVRAMDADISADLRRDLQGILHAGRAAGVLTANLLGFARQGRYRQVRFDVNAVAADATGQVRSRGRAAHATLATTLPIVEGDPDQVRDAVFAVCQNAVDATPVGGRVHLETSALQVEPGHATLKPGTHVRLEIRDEGTWMSEDVRARATEPFFTTRAVGAGTGLGLSMAFGVIRNHGGELRIDSTLGVGTTVTMSLPVALSPTPTPSLPPPSPPAAPAPGREVALVVDDDEWVRHSSRALLEALDYEVAEAADGISALREFQRHLRVAFVLLDLRMPGMDGEEVLRRLVVIDPRVRVILCTGYHRQQVSQRLFTMGRVGFLGKPFTLGELAAEVSRIVGETA